MARTTKADLAAQGEQAVVRAFRSLSHQVETGPEGSGWDLIATVDGIEVPIELEAAAVVTPETVVRMVAQSDKRRKDLADLAVGDLVTAAAQDALREAGWGWLDRRGHLVLRAKGVHIDADVSADERPTAGTPAHTISGMAAISWAAALLMSPEDPPAMREVARRLSLSHSAIVAAAKKLKAASLVRADGRPLVPELFWALAEEWHPAPVALAELPPAGDAKTYGALEVNLDEGPGWAVAGTIGAAAIRPGGDDGEHLVMTHATQGAEDGHPRFVVSPVEVLDDEDNGSIGLDRTHRFEQFEAHREGRRLIGDRIQLCHHAVGQVGRQLVGPRGQHPEVGQRRQGSADQGALSGTGRTADEDRARPSCPCLVGAPRDGFERVDAPDERVISADQRSRPGSA
jgi:hypothetical protein